MYKTLSKAFLILSLAMVQVVQGYAQDDVTTITLASPQAMPGDRTYLTSLLTNAGEVSVYHLQHWIEFPKDKLQYVSVRLGIAADLAKGVLTLELQEKPSSGQGMPEASSEDEALSADEAMIAEGEAMIAAGEVMIAAGEAILAGEAITSDDELMVLYLSIKGDQAFPDGPIVEVTFNVAHIEPQTIVFTHRLEAFDEQGEKISELVFSDGTLHVSLDMPDLPPAIFACLFYMH
ncbi:MAG: hypothetical protein O7G29_14490 [Acidobacteria bacterium]|nr:hypothetical protein [Acidobacteriota bacterium]